MHYFIVLMFLLVGCSDTQHAPQQDLYSRGPQGLTGDTGAAGSDGKDGRDGVDGVGQDGKDGLDGEDGQDGTIISLFDPCDDYPGWQDEILFIMDDGQIVAWYQATGLVSLTPGNYVTTDKQKCYFTVTADFQITNEHE